MHKISYIYTGYIKIIKNVKKNKIKNDKKN